MIPRQRAPVTSALLWANIVVHFIVHVLVIGSKGEQGLIDVLYTFGLVPTEFWHGAWWQPVTSLFLHGFFLHIFVNMLALWSLGTPIESTVGSGRFAFLYFVSGATGSLFVLLFQSDISLPTVGASGAVMGLLGALAVYFPNAGLLVFFIPMRARTAAILFGAGSVVLALVDSDSGISHMGHLGGLIGGVLYSRFALGFKIGRQSFDASTRRSSGYRQWPFRPGEAGEDEQRYREIMDFLNRFQQGRRGGAGKRPATQSDETPVIYRPDGTTEKIINPIPDDEDEAARESDQKETGPDGDTGGSSGRRLYYDPITGRFYIK